MAISRRMRWPRAPDDARKLAAAGKHAEAVAAFELAVRAHPDDVTASEDGGKKFTSRAGLTLTWVLTGALDVGGEAPDAGSDALDGESLLGHHLITFP